MALLKIARMGHGVLRARAEAVADPTAPDVARLVRDMKATLLDTGGIGLAAPQVHESRRVVVFFVPKSRAGDPEGREGAPDAPVPLTVLINPEIEPLGDTTVLDWEACLSVPGLAGLVPRYTRIRYRAVDLAGNSVDRVAEGFHARVVQHECDHLDGILYPQRVTDITHMGFADEIRRFPPAAAGPAR